MIKEQLGNITLYQCDCMEYTKTCDDNQFDLAIVDPEYLDKHQPTQTMRKKGLTKKWNGRPNIMYFDELFRISKNQIIWGGNYFTSFLPENNNWIVWYKNNDGVCFSMAELAWSSIRKPIKVYELRPMGKTANFHPTSKPVKLYKWLLKNYAKQNDKIFDSHFGSLSIGLACHDMGFELTACELDKEYYEKAKERLKIHQMQLKIL